jgi:hypothetical protein
MIGLVLTFQLVMPMLKVCGITLVPNGTAAMRTVDQSIQPGDGGFGFNLELNAWHKLSKTFVAYFQGYYLFNPRNKHPYDLQRFTF